jgi:PhoPQ-activated pathogenicity-related protein
MVAGHFVWPDMKWKYTDTPEGVSLNIGSDLQPRSVRLFRVNSATQDFRDSKWTFEEIPSAKRRVKVTADAPKEGYSAVFGEVTYDLDGQPFTLSTQIHILSAKK